MAETTPCKRKRTGSGDLTDEIPKKQITSKKLTTDDSGDDSDCKILEESIPVVTLDTSIEADSEATGDELSQTAAAGNNGIPVDMEAAEVSSPPEDLVGPEYLLRLNFKDCDTFNQLKAAVRQAVREALFKMKKTVEMTENPDRFEIIITETEQLNGEDCVFMVDSTPAHSTTKANRNDVPQYSLNMTRVLNNAVVEIPTEKCAKAAKPKNTCFNCDGDHAIRDCPEPKNFAKINQNRSKFGSRKTERYHMDVDQRFGQFQPGDLSTELREALGLSKRDLPMHIYRMRLLGYPPGWLEDAKVSKSGLALFDSQGKEICADEEEPGEVTEVVQYDLKKIISFPGFNVKPGSGIIDNHDRIRAPPMRLNQSKETMIEALQGNSAKAYKCKKLKNLPMAQQSPTDLELTSAEMDVEESECIPDMPVGVRVDLSAPPLPPGTEPPPPPPVALPLPSNPINENIDNPGSPSLDDLRKKKERLLAALDDSSITITNESVLETDDSLIDDIMALDDTQSSFVTTMAADDEDGINLSSMSTPISQKGPSNYSRLEVITTPTESEAATQLNTSKSAPSIVTPLNSSKQRVLGTPLIKSVSPFSTLPVGASWSEGVSDIIDFENLPDGTGKYEKMKDIIKKVRVVVKELNEECD